jgi:6,7-dimethyl-8-ribityllumazine synthase
MSTRARQRSGIDDVANLLNTVVTGGVEFQHVVAGAYFHGLAGIALTTRLATHRILTVENLGQNACGGGFTSSAGTREKIGLALSPINDSVS